jgi:hypothetical protein
MPLKLVCLNLLSIAALEISRFPRSVESRVFRSINPEIYEPAFAWENFLALASGKHTQQPSWPYIRMILRWP